MARPYCIYCGGALPLLDGLRRGGYLPGDVIREANSGHGLGFCTVGGAESGVSPVDLTRRSAAERFAALDAVGELTLEDVDWRSLTIGEGAPPPTPTGWVSIPSGVPPDSQSWDALAEELGVELELDDPGDSEWRELHDEVTLWWPGSDRRPWVWLAGLGGEFEDG